MVRRHELRSGRQFLAFMLVIMLVAASGCSRKPASPGLSPDGAVHDSGSPAVTPPAGGPQPTVPPPRPAPYTGTGLLDPYINDQGELELIFADARGTVKLGTGKGIVATAALSADRMMLAYAVAPPKEGHSYPDDRVYIVDASADPWQEQELSEARNSPICELAFSPCGQYLSVDAGTSVVRGLSVVRVSDGALVGAAGVFSRFAWSPGTPSRLAVGLMTDRPLAPGTELDETIDTVIVEYPSGRLTYIKRGTMNEFWAPNRWQDNGRLELAHYTRYPDGRETVAVAVPPGLADVRSAPTGSGPLPPHADARPERDLAGQLLLAAPDGAVLRRLTDRSLGLVVDYALSSDGRILAYTWQGKDEDHTRLFQVSLPDLSTSEVDIGSYRKGATGYGPRSLSFAPGETPLLLAVWGYESARVYDLNRRTAREIVGAYPVWVPKEAIGDTPLLVIGQRSVGSPIMSMGAGYNLMLVDASNGGQTTLIQCSDEDSYYPIGFAEDGAVLAMRQHAFELAEIVRVELPR